MNFEHYIAKQIYSGKESRFSKPIVRLSIISIAIGLIVMIIAISTVTGFQKEIRNKIIGFSGHLQIEHYDFNTSLESAPISKYQPFYPSIGQLPEVESIYMFAQKGGLIKTSDQIHGVVLKGLGSDYNWKFFKENLVEGRVPVYNDSVASPEVLISKTLADKMKLKIDDPLRMYFVSQNGSAPRGRKFSIVGLYDTGLADLDEQIVLGNIMHVQKLNRWEDNQVGGFQMILKSFDDMDVVIDSIYSELPYDLAVTKVTSLYPGIFDWLNLLDTNVYIVLTMMVLIAVITMISTLLILILERISMIGILKSLGTKNRSVRLIFIYNATYIIRRGMLYGNIIGYGLLLIQYYTHILKLDPQSYFVNVVPVNFSLMHFLLLNIGTLVICVFFMLFPSYLVSKIKPSKSIRYS
ncbi:MAG: ABC transporter permease [Hyphomicrobiales bacterium]